MAVTERIRRLLHRDSQSLTAPPASPDNGSRAATEKQLLVAASALRLAPLPVADLIALLERAADALHHASEDIAEIERTFDLRRSADMRAIERWRAAHPGNDLRWPDHTDLVVWLMSERDRTQ